MPNYTKNGKSLNVITPLKFKEVIANGKFVKWQHAGLFSLIYYTGIRRHEASRSLKKQFQITDTTIYYDVLKRLKHGKHTPVLELPVHKTGVDLIKKCVEKVKQKNKRVWPYSDRTVYNIVRRSLNTYPHHLRLSRITNLFTANYTIPQVKTFTGLTLNTLDSYVGRVDIKKMGETLE